jgi:eukaryotic-like serine/threonine-protein kinase
VSRSFITSSSHRVLGAKYRLVRPLVAGGMGTVWIAEHLSLRSAVAVKLLSREIAETEEGEQRFLREARTAASLRSPHVVQILDHGVDAGTPYIVMELLDGESLATRLQREQQLGPVQTERIVRHVARAVGRAHEAGIAHRDLKPSNIFIVANDEEELVKVLDFGIAKTSEEWTSALAGRTRTGTFLGTPGYVSPEQAEGARTVDYRTDIWSLGVIAFECLLGRPPFVGESFGSLLLAICSRPLPVPSEHGPLPRGFDEWFARACARDPEQRFQSAREASNELRRLLDLSGGEASGPGLASGELRPEEPVRPRLDLLAESVASGVSSRPPFGMSAGAASVAPFGSTAVSSGSGIAPRREQRRGRWVILASALGIVALGLLARSCFDSHEPKPLEVMAQEALRPKPVASMPAAGAAAPEAPSGLVVVPASLPELPLPEPSMPEPSPLEGGTLGTAAAELAPAAKATPRAERRVRWLRPASAAARPAEARAPASHRAPTPPATSSINLGLVPPEPAPSRSAP